MSRIRRKVRQGTATSEERAKLAAYKPSNRGRKVKNTAEPAKASPAEPATAPPSHGAVAGSPLRTALQLDPATKNAPAAPAAPPPGAGVEPEAKKPAEHAHCGDPNCVSCAYPPDKKCPVTGNPVYPRMNPRAGKRAAKLLFDVFDLLVKLRDPSIELRPVPPERVEEMAEGLVEMSWRRAGFISAVDDVLMVAGSGIEHTTSRVGEYRAHAKRVEAVKRIEETSGTYTESQRRDLTAAE